MTRVTENRVSNDYAVQWIDDPPDKWQHMTSHPDEDDHTLDELCKARGLWDPGQPYPDFTIWCNGQDIASGGGPNSGMMEVSYPTTEGALERIATTEFRPFTKKDWSAFAGCMTKNPIIGESDWFVIVIDGYKVLFLSHGDDGEGNTYIMLRDQ